MKASVSDSRLNERLRAYMRGGEVMAFALDVERLRQSGKTMRQEKNMRWLSYVAAFVVLLVSAVSIPPVRAAVGRFFTFIPGVGIVEKTDSTVYAMTPIIGRTGVPTVFTSPPIQAELENAIYANGTLNVSVLISGKRVEFDDFTLYVNGKSVEFQSSGWSAWGDKFTMGHSMWLKTATPSVNDLFEIEIQDFGTRLSFTMEACADYDDLAGIGATDTKNGIPITTTASRNENLLTVWCYPFNTSGDKVTGIGEPTPSIWNSKTYIETESGHTSRHAASGQKLVERFVFEMPEGDESATLHIPYLTLVRDEQQKVTLRVPVGYETVECDVSAEFSLGIVRVTEVTRKPNENGDGTDMLSVNFDFTSLDDSKVFNSFRMLDANGAMASYMSSFDEESGRLQYIETAIDDNASKFTFTITDLCYYLLGEYVIPLEVK